MTRRRIRDLPVLALVGAAALVAGLLLALVPLPGAVRVVLGLPLILVAPGWALVSACFSGRPLDPVMRVLLTFAASIAVAIVGGLLLSAVTIRLGTTSFALLAATATAVAALVGVRLGAESGPVRLPAIAAPGTVLLLGGALVGAVLTLVFARQAPPTRAVAPYTALWTKRVSPHRWLVGVTSGQLHTSTYRLDSVLTGRRRDRLQITLRPGQRWVKLLSSHGRIYPHRVELRRRGSGTIYRSVDVPREP